MKVSVCVINFLVLMEFCSKIFNVVVNFAKGCRFVTKCCVLQGILLFFQQKHENFVLKVIDLFEFLLKCYYFDMKVDAFCTVSLITSVLQQKVTVLHLFT